MNHVEKMREARKAPQRYLLQYNNLRSRIGDSIYIAVLEGKEDVPIYVVWFNRIVDRERFEPMEVNGKKNLFGLLDLFTRSKEVSDDRTLFFADHDFDGLQGNDSCDRLYVTTAYSVENYIVTREVFGQILICDFGLIGDKQPFRKPLLEIFERRMKEFAETIAPANAFMRWLRLEVAELKVSFPDSVTKAVTISFDKVQPIIDFSIPEICEWLDAPAAPTRVAFDYHAAYLKDKDPCQHTRGKFMFEFLRHIVCGAYSDMRSDAPKYFPETDRNRPDPAVDLLRRAANYSSPPDSLRVFLEKWLKTPEEQ